MNAKSSNDDCQSIFDSANIFNQTSKFGINIKPSIKDTETNYRIGKWLNQLPFQKLSCLLKSKIIAFKALGLIYAESNFEDSLLKNYHYLLNDTSSVQLIDNAGNVVSQPDLTLRTFFLSAIIQKAKDFNDTLVIKREIELVVSVFIKQYSQYPNSYNSISFPYFAISFEDNFPVFNIKHVYKIKNKEGKTERVTSAFLLDQDLNINAIEKDSTSYIYSSPPQFGNWLKEFGKNLDQNDSLILKLK